MPARRCVEPISLPVGGCELLFDTTCGVAARETAAKVQGVVSVWFRFSCPSFSASFFGSACSCLFPPAPCSACSPPPGLAPPSSSRLEFWMRWGMNSARLEQLLVVAGMDRLDTELTAAHMQGRRVKSGGAPTVDWLPFGVWDVRAFFGKGISMATSVIRIVCRLDWSGANVLPYVVKQRGRVGVGGETQRMATHLTFRRVTAKSYIVPRHLTLY